MKKNIVLLVTCVDCGANLLENSVSKTPIKPTKNGGERHEIVVGRHECKPKLKL